MLNRTRDYLQFLCFLALLWLCAAAPSGCCTAEPQSDIPDSGLPAPTDSSVPALDASTHQDSAADSATPDATADGPVDATAGWSRCGDCWAALGNESATCAALGAGPIMMPEPLSDYRTCGQCAELHTVAVCYTAPLTPEVP